MNCSLLMGQTVPIIEKKLVFATNGWLLCAVYFKLPCRILTIFKILHVCISVKIFV
jgi:hypothetical protein